MEKLPFTQVRVFWRSMEELVLNNNEQEKLSVRPKWIFRPARYKRYIYDKRIGRSHCLEVHEREEPFTFHNCCIAARVDEEGVRERRPQESSGRGNSSHRSFLRIRLMFPARGATPNGACAPFSFPL